MLSRREFGLALVGATFPFIVRGQTKPALRLGLVADPQYADIPPVATRFYRQSPDKLAAAIEYFNTLELDACINCGDAIDRDWSSFNTILGVFSKSKVKFNHVLGNHDFDLLDIDKARAPARLGMERKYYAINKLGFCLAMLDTNDVSIYAQPLNAPETATAAAEMKRYSAAGVPQAYPWNAAIGPAQMKWLEETCAKAKEANQKVILFGHHPVLPEGAAHTHNLWNSGAMVAFVKKQRHVVAWFNGHNHQGAYAVDDGVPFITLKGMVETKDTNAYSTLELFDDRLVIKGQGREPSREVVFRKA